MSEPDLRSTSSRSWTIRWHDPEHPWADVEGAAPVRLGEPVEVVSRDVAEALARAVSASLAHGEDSPLAGALKAYLADCPWSDL